MVTKKAKKDPNSSLLKPYQAKRNFKKSNEPPGSHRTRLSEEQNQRFVLHKHAASRLHYDLRLESEGVLKSWAIPKGPSQDPLEKRLCVRVEDHPLEYYDFEAPIPAGNYGAGTIMIWDAGSYCLYEALSGESHDQTFSRQYKKGNLKLDMRGERIKGLFALVRTEKGSGANWLLIKKRDRHASSIDLLAEETSVRSGKTMEEIAAGVSKKKRSSKPLSKKNFSKTLVLAKTAKKKPVPVKWRPSISVNATGQRSQWLVVAHVKASGPEIYTTKGLNLTPRLPKLSQALAQYPAETVFLGHLNNTQAEPPLVVTDIIWFSAYCTGDLPEKIRQKLLTTLSFEGALVLGTDAETNSKKLTRQVWLSHPKKIYWPKEKFTKEDLFNYYKNVSSVLLPHLKNRPQSLNRHPNGIKAKSFFQKEVAGSIPAWMATTHVDAYQGKKTVTHLMIQDLDSLLYVVNLGCIELNPWLSSVPHLHSPDFVVIDIDPGQLEFSYVIKAAKFIQRLLERIGAHSFCKTSGGRGLHIYLPLDKEASFEQTQAFAKSVGVFCEASSPILFSNVRAPLLRQKKIYVDALQNRRGQTMASVYSVRPRLGAPVSMPIKWSELGSKLDPGKFNLKTAIRRLDKVGDLWGGFFEKTNNISILLEEVQKCLY